MEYSPTHLTLNFVKLLRNERIPEEVADPSKGIPVSTIRWILEQLKIESSVIYIYLSAGRQQTKQKIYGANNIWKNYEDECNTKSNSKLLLKITFRMMGKNHSSDPIGYLGVHKSSGFDVEESIALNDIAQFLGDYMYDVFYSNRRLYFNKALRKFNEIAEYNKKPGTIIKLIQAAITRSTRAHASYFIILNNDKLVVEYFQKPYWNKPAFAENHPIYQAPPTFYKLCQKNIFFQWVDLRKEDRLCDILKNYVSSNDEVWEYLIGVSKEEKVSTALWIFQYNKNQLIFYDLYKDLILRGVYISRKNVNYLFQRRYQKLIVDPIFRNRDTVVDDNQVFIIMPFHESWSKRIWSRLINPIVTNEGLQPIRADDLFGRDIMEDIWKGILSSRIIIADITTRNPNVFYELGIAHTIGKEVILLTQDIKDIPFDLNRYRHIVYEDNLDGYEKLEKQLKSSIRDILRGRH